MTMRDRLFWEDQARQIKARASAEDIQERLADVVMSWPERPHTPPEAMIEVRADLITRSWSEIDRLRKALDSIIDLPAGSQGGYGKFAQAQRIAKDARDRK